MSHSSLHFLLTEFLPKSISSGTAVCVKSGVPGLGVYSKKGAMDVNIDAAKRTFLSFKNIFWCGPFLESSFSGGTSSKESACQCRKCKRQGFDPWVGKIHWRRAWQPTPVFLPGEFHGQRNLAGYSPCSCKKSDTTERLSTLHLSRTLGVRLPRWSSG